MTAATLAPAQVAGLCDWESFAAYHAAYHPGQVCPFEVVAALLAGHPDPRERVRRWELPLTFEKPPLSLNDRKHFRVVAKSKQLIAAEVRQACRDAGVPVLERVHVELHYRPKANRTMDQDNLVATLKPAIDALHHAAPEGEDWCPVVPGDDPRYVTWVPPVLHRAERGKPGRVWLILSSTDAQQSGTLSA